MDSCRKDRYKTQRISLVLEFWFQAEGGYIAYSQVTQIILYHKYNRRQFVKDIALLKLNESAKLTRRVQLICLPTQEYLSDYNVDHGTEGWVSEKNSYHTTSLHSLVTPHSFDGRWQGGVTTAQIPHPHPLMNYDLQSMPEMVVDVIYLEYQEKFLPFLRPPSVLDIDQTPVLLKVRYSITQRVIKREHDDKF